MESARLSFRFIKEKDKELFFLLNTDESINKYWGYDYHDDLNGQEVNSDYFYNMVIEDNIKKETINFIVCLKNSDIMIGEAVIHNIKNNEAEVGLRLFKEYQQFGYGKEILSFLTNYLFKSLNYKKVNAKCYKENISSYKLLSKMMNYTNSDETYHYFINQKLNTLEDYKKLIGKSFKAIIDRPLGSLHPIHNFLYELNYGYLPNIYSNDFEETDVYIIDEIQPLTSYEGIIIGVVYRKNDIENKLIMAKNNHFSDEEIIKKINFQEQWFDIELYR